MYEDRTVLKEYVDGGPVWFEFEVIRHGKMMSDGDETSRLINPLTNYIIPIYYHPVGVPFIQQEDKNKDMTTLVKPIRAVYHNIRIQPTHYEEIDVSTIGHMWISEKLNFAKGDICGAFGHIEVYNRRNKQGRIISASYCFTRTSEIVPLGNKGVC